MGIQSWIIAAVVIDFLVILANLIEITILLKKWKKLDRIEHLLLSLATADLITGLTMFVLDLIVLYDTLNNGKPRMAKTENLVMECLIMFFLLVSNFHVVSIAVERLVAVILPLKYHVFTTFKCKCFTVITVWLASTLIAPTITVFLHLYYTDSSAEGKSLGRLLYCGIMLVGCVCVFSIYTALACALIVKERRTVALLPEEMRKHVRDRKTTMFCLLIGSCYVVCFLPMTIGLFENTLKHPIADLLITINHLLNPFIYFAKSYQANRSRANSLAKTRLISRERLSTRGDSVLKRKRSAEDTTLEEYT